VQDDQALDSVKKEDADELPWLRETVSRKKKL